MMGRKVDPITAEVVGNAVQSVTEEMGVALVRSAYSTNIKERRDFSCGVFANVYERSALGAGYRFDGPAIVEEPESTTLIGPDWHAAVAVFDNLVIEKSSGNPAIVIAIALCTQSPPYLRPLQDIGRMSMRAIGISRRCPGG